MSGHCARQRRLAACVRVRLVDVFIPGPDTPLTLLLSFFSTSRPLFDPLTGLFAALPAPSSAVRRYDRTWMTSPVDAKGDTVLDHLSLQCADVSVSRAFYDAVLPTIGGRCLMDFGDTVGYGVPPMPDFWLGPQRTGQGVRETHVAFSAPDRAAVRAFVEAGRAAGAEVLHEPRPWPEYHPNYYGGFVRDPDGKQRGGRVPHA